MVSGWVMMVSESEVQMFLTASTTRRIVEWADHCTNCYVNVATVDFRFAYCSTRCAEDAWERMHDRRGH